MIGGIEASLRRIAHYDYWSDKVRRSILPDAKADLLIYGNAERAIVEVAHRLAQGEKIGDIRDLRGTAFMVPHRLAAGRRWEAVDRPRSIRRGRWSCMPTPTPWKRARAAPSTARSAAGEHAVRIVTRAERLAAHKDDRAHTVDPPAVL